MLAFLSGMPDRVVYMTNGVCLFRRLVRSFLFGHTYDPP